MPELEVVGPPHLVVALEHDRYVIGKSSDADVVVESDPTVSRRHATLTERDGTWYVADLQSRNGTWVNRERVVDERALQDRDRLQVGKTSLIFHDGSDAGASASYGAGDTIATRKSEARWEAIVKADREHFARIAPAGITFPERWTVRRFMLTGAELTIGVARSPRGVRPDIDLSGAVSDDGISHLHAMLLRQADGAYALVDQGSTNGTFVNQEQERIALNEPRLLRDGDEIHIGAWTTVTIIAADSDAGAGDAYHDRPSQRGGHDIHPLPVQMTAFFGRQAEVDRLASRVPLNHLVTVTGPGGVGKTRLALEVAAEISGDYSDGVYLVDVASITGDESVAVAVASALRMREGGSGTYAVPARRRVRPLVQRIADRIGARPMLVVLDNCEIATAACAGLLEVLFRRCGGLHVLATSREPIGVAGEAILRLPPMALGSEDEPAEDVRANPAVQLFIDRARLRDPGLEIDDDALRMVATICRELDGIPLAIELAAAQAGVLALPEVAAMVRGPVARDERQSALATIAWVRLSDDEAMLLRRISVFAGGFDLDAVRPVCAPSADNAEVVSIVGRLVERSLVECDPHGRASRFRLLGATRDLASQQLQFAGEEEATREAHLAWFVTRAEQIEGELTGANQAQCFDSLETDDENLRAAVATARELHTRDDLRIAGALGLHWIVRGRLSEGAKLLDDALSGNPVSDSLRAKGLCIRGLLACFAGDLDRAESVAHEALAITSDDAMPDKRYRACALGVRGLVQSGRGNLDLAVEDNLDAISLAQETADEWLTAFVLTNLGNVLALQGATASARQRYEEAVAIRRARGDLWGLTWSLFRLGALTAAQGRYGDARTLFTESLARAREVGFAQGEVLALLGLGDSLYANDDAKNALAAYDEALVLARRIAEPASACLALAGLANVNLAAGDFRAAARRLSEPEAAQADRTPTTFAAVLRAAGMRASAEGDDAVAESSHRRALQVRHDIGDQRGVCEELEALMVLAVARGDLTRAAALLGGAEKLRERIGMPVPPVSRAAYDSAIAQVLAARDDTVHVARRTGARERLDNLVAFACGEEGDAIEDTPTKRHAEEVARLANTDEQWARELEQSLLAAWPDERARGLFDAYRAAFPASYWAEWPAKVAAEHIRRIEALDQRLSARLERPSNAEEGELRLELLHTGEPIAIHEFFATLENLGVWVLDHRSYPIRRSGAAPVWIDHFRLMCAQPLAVVDSDVALDRCAEAFRRVFEGVTEDDGFNRLVLSAGLTWREVMLLRAYSKYLRQLDVPFAQPDIEAALTAHREVTRLLVDLFHARFDPSEPRQSGDELSVKLTEQLLVAIDEIESLDEDRILRGLLDVVLATTRTSFYATAGDDASGRVACKFDPAKIPLLPRPRPEFEIFVYSPRVEGVHLRGGRIARGGIRWSDRHDDFRTEILGLMKAQTVKNSVIVPVGAKGGFVVKQRPPDQSDLAGEVVACYRTFIRSLLELTDNIVDGAVVSPPDIVRYDADDPYLVVAADKGTATFSDIANELSLEHSYWLGDAFASGGSSGYDHKQMAITARGGWESVRRHFRELGIDADRESLSMVGVGDMSGDVFGNGLLRSRFVRLVGAFDHRHIFLDPDPEPESAFAERERLFHLAGSSWADYDPSLISSGGGVFARSAKSIELTDEARALLGRTESALAPHDLIRALLCARADLIWNGAIGTFVKASSETHHDAADRSNDAIRVDADELRVAVVGEGGNLGFTQAARVELARAGGKINTDAIDNSAGVDCSDHEVNLKILLNRIVETGELTHKERDALLEEMRDDVAANVLRHNFQQARVLARNARWAPAMAATHARYIRFLEQAGRLVPELEDLPPDNVLLERASRGEGLVTPELAVLLAYTKIMLVDELLASELVDDPYFERELLDYLPTVVRDRFGATMAEHPLRREIIANAIVNDLVDHHEVSFVFRLQDETGASASDVARAFVIADEVVGLDKVWSAIDEPRATLAPEVDAVCTRSVCDQAEWVARWLLRHQHEGHSIVDDIGRLRAPIEALWACLSDVLDADERGEYDSRVAELRTEGMADELAGRVAGCAQALAAPDLVDLAGADGDLRRTSEAYFALGQLLDLSWLRGQIDALPKENQWQWRAGNTLREDLHHTQRALAASVLRSDRDAPDGRAAAEAWVASHAERAVHVQRLVAEMRNASDHDAAAITVAIRELSSLVVG
jgi:NAD-specific glutamate dehydrogenase/predicted ATPase/pSer/pThr/pTyr-binding forkhead associated (FHA) protein